MSAARTERRSGGPPSDHKATDWGDASSYAYTRTLTRAEWMEEFVQRSRGDVPPRQNCIPPARKLRLARVSGCPVEGCLRRLVALLARRFCSRVARGNP